MPKIRIDWRTIDWTPQNVTLAEKYGYTQQAVTYARRKHGTIKRAYNHRRCRHNPISEKIEQMQTGDMTRSEVAKAVGCHMRYAAFIMKKMGKPYKLLPPLGSSKYDWSKFPTNWRQLTDDEIAKIVGVPNAIYVAVWRRNHGYLKRRPNKNR